MPTSGSDIHNLVDSISASVTDILTTSATVTGQAIKDALDPITSVTENVMEAASTAITSSINETKTTVVDTLDVISDGISSTRDTIQDSLTETSEAVRYFTDESSKTLVSFSRFILIGLILVAIAIIYNASAVSELRMELDRSNRN